MIIPYIIGKNSNGENQHIDLCEIPLLMISYSNEDNLNNIFKQVYLHEYPYKGTNYLITNTRRLELLGIRQNSGYIYLKDEPASGSIHSRWKMLKKVNDEIARRKNILKAKRAKDFQRYFSLNLWNEEKLTYQFLLIDDIWDIIMSGPKSLGISLIGIILYGPMVGIHTIFASRISYRNLLQQLVNINPAITNALQAKYGIPAPKQIGLLGHEIIFTPDDLVYYKKRSMGDMERYYKL